MKYAIYTRCSTEEQSNGFSHDYQIHGLQSSHKLQDGQCIGIFSDTISGTTFVRPELDKLIRHCQVNRGEVSFVFIYRWDRFGRDMTERFQVIRVLKDLGVEINCPESWVNFGDPTWPLLMGINMGMAQSESLKISDRTKDGIYQANLAGFFTGRAPVGYKREMQLVAGKQRSVLVPDPVTAPLVRKMFELVAQGANRGELKRKYGPKIGYSGNNFNLIFRNILYAGYVQVRPYKTNTARTVKGAHEGIISLSLYEKVQSILDEGRTHYAPKIDSEDYFIAKSCIQCSLTGKKMTTYWSKGRSKKYPYYSTPGVKGSILKADLVHKSIYEVMRLLIANRIPEAHYEVAKAQFLKTMSKEREQINIYSSEIKSIKARMSGIEDDYLKNRITPENFNRISTKLNAMLSEMEEKLKEVEATSRLAIKSFETFMDLISNLGNVFANSTNTGKERLLKLIFPSGFTIDRNYQLRTAQINQVIELFYSESGIYDFVEGKKKERFLESPLLGGEESEFRTHLQLLLAAV